MTQKTLKLNDDWDLFVDTKGDLSVTDKTSKNYAIAQDRNLIGVAMLTLINGDKIDVNF